MSTTFPTTKQTIPNPTATDLLENASPTLDHDYQHATINDTVEALEDKVGIDGSVVTTSHSYKLALITGANQAVSTDGTGQTLTNITLTNPQMNFGGDATGDMYYRSALGTTARLPIGTAGQIIQTSVAGIPEWIANPSAADASETQKGVVEEATQAQVDAGTDVGETGAHLFVTPSKMKASSALQNNGTIQYGGDGSDGALVSATTLVTVDLGGLSYVVKNYSSISITGTGSVKFINAAATGTVIVVKCQGLMTLTSSTIPNLSASGAGGMGGAGGNVSGTVTGTNGNTGIGALDASIHYGAGATSTTVPSTGGLILANTPFYTKNAYELSRGITLACGSGGGGGGAVTGNGSGGAITGTANGGAGGNGGGVLIIECGSINFTVSGGISVNGESGVAGGAISSSVGANGYAGSGGGGGSAGMCVVLYKTAVAATGTISSAGGMGGAGGAASNVSGGSGGGAFSAYGGGAGAGAYGGAGGDGAATVSMGSSNGGNGAAGGGVSAGSGGGSGAAIQYNVSASNFGGAGGTIGASNGGLIAKNYFL